METWKECAECARRFEPQRRANRFYRADGPRHKGAKYCSAGCKQKAYRRRRRRDFRASALKPVLTPLEQ
jgi:hypothetical protein